MKNNTTRFVLGPWLIVAFAAAAFSQSHIFTYQGKLSDTGTPPTGTYQMEFRLFDSLSGSGQIGNVVPNNAVSVVDGVFNVTLNFGGPTTTFTGGDRFLQISLRRNAGESFVTLNPRQQITSSPYSIRTLSAAQADTALDSNQLGGLPANQYLQTNGNGSGLTNLNASNISTGTLANARLGQIPTANIADNAVTAPKIAPGQVVKGVTVGATTLTDNVTLAQGSNITITPTGNTLTIASTGGGGGGVGGSGTTNTLPIWSGGQVLGNSLISQSGNDLLLPTRVLLAPTAQGDSVTFGTPNSETGVTIGGAASRADIRFGSSSIGGGTTLKLVAGPAGGPPGEANGIAINTDGRVRIGTVPGEEIFSTKVQVNGGPIVGLTGVSTSNSGVYGVSTDNNGVRGVSTSGTGVAGTSAGVNGTGIEGTGRIGVRGAGSLDGVRGTSTSTTNGAGLIGINTSGGFAGLFNGPVSTSGSLGVNIGFTQASRTLEVNGRARIGSIPPEASTASVCFNVAGDLLQCGGSSLRWKTNVHSFSDGLNILGQLRPIGYNWKESGEYDIGLGAEDVAKVAPFFAFRNKEGVVEGVRYERLNMLLINAVNEQQEQIETLRAENAALKKQTTATEGRLVVLEQMMRRLTEQLATTPQPNRP